MLADFEKLRSSVEGFEPTLRRKATRGNRSVDDLREAASRSAGALAQAVRSFSRRHGAPPARTFRNLAVTLPGSALPAFNDLLQHWERAGAFRSEELLPRPVRRQLPGCRSRTVVAWLLDDGRAPSVGVIARFAEGNLAVILSFARQVLSAKDAASPRTTAQLLKVLCGRGGEGLSDLLREKLLQTQGSGQPLARLDVEHFSRLARPARRWLAADDELSGLLLSPDAIRWAAKHPAVDPPRKPRPRTGVPAEVTRDALDRIRRGDWKHPDLRSYLSREDISVSRVLGTLRAADRRASGNRRPSTKMTEADFGAIRSSRLRNAIRFFVTAPEERLRLLCFFDAAARARLLADIGEGQWLRAAWLCRDANVLDSALTGIFAAGTNARGQLLRSLLRVPKSLKVLPPLLRVAFAEADGSNLAELFRRYPEEWIHVRAADIESEPYREMFRSMSDYRWECRPSDFLRFTRYATEEVMARVFTSADSDYRSFRTNAAKALGSSRNAEARASFERLARIHDPELFRAKDGWNRRADVLRQTGPIAAWNVDSLNDSACRTFLKQFAFSPRVFADLLEDAAPPVLERLMSDRGTWFREWRTALAEGFRESTNRGFRRTCLRMVVQHAPHPQRFLAEWSLGRHDFECILKPTTDWSVEDLDNGFFRRFLDECGESPLVLRDLARDLSDLCLERLFTGRAGYCRTWRARALGVVCRTSRTRARTELLRAALRTAPGWLENVEGLRVSRGEFVLLAEETLAGEGERSVQGLLALRGSKGPPVWQEVLAGIADKELALVQDLDEAVSRLVPDSEPLLAESRERRERKEQRLRCRALQVEREELEWSLLTSCRSGQVELSAGQLRASIPWARRTWKEQPTVAVAHELALAFSLRDAGYLRYLCMYRWDRREAAGPGRVFDELYRTYQRPKRSGGVRTITVPVPRLRGLQRRILHGGFDEVALHAAAHGFRKEHSILTNAAPHVGAECVVNVDIASFFPETPYDLVYRACRFAGGGELTEAARRVLADICCYDGALPTGAPTSPAIANLVLRSADASIAKAAATNGITYTRYADDLTFSGSGRVPRILPFVERVLGELGYRLDPKKTNIFRRGRRQMVTGLVVNEKPNVPRRLRRRLRAAVHRRSCGKDAHWHGKPMEDEQLAGRLAFLQLVQPDEAAGLARQLEASRPGGCGHDGGAVPHVSEGDPDE